MEVVPMNEAIANYAEDNRNFRREMALYAARGIAIGTGNAI